MYEELVTPPAALPVSIAEQAAFSRFDVPGAGSAEETLVSGFIASATAQAETITRRAFITQTWRLHLDGFPPLRHLAHWQEGHDYAYHEVPHKSQRRTDIILPHPPVQSVTSVKYIDESGNEQTVDPSIYTLEQSSPARIVLKENQSWPGTAPVSDSVTVEFVAGYGANASNVPEGIRLAIKYFANAIYDKTPLAERVSCP